MFGVLAVMIAFTRRSIWIQQGVSIILLMFLLCNIWSMQNAAAELRATNAAERHIAEQIVYLIERYETENDIVVENMGFVYDDSVTWHFSGTTQAFAEQGQSAYTVSWNRLPCIYYYTGRWFNNVDVPDGIYDEYFAGKDWDTLDLSEQLVFDANNAYLVVY